MKVLSVASECAPLVKTGGLADVAGALPGALAGLGVEMRTVLPGYPAVMDALADADGEAAWSEDDLFGGPGHLIAARVAGLDLLVLDAPHLFDRAGGPYGGPDGDWPDNPERFAALSWAAAAVARGRAGWRPDILHAHDWQAGLAPLYAAETPSVLTIHNVAFQGMAPADRIGSLRLPPERFDEGGYEFWGQVSTLKAGMVWADKVTTVSPTYAAELTTPEFGMGLEGVLRARRADLSGILNGVDLEAWTPPYASPKGKAKHKAALRAEMGLGEADGPLCVLVSRLSHQKGIDILLDALPRLVDEGGQLALLGSGDAALEDRLRGAAAHPHVAVRIGYDEGLAHRMIAGGDAILVPSRFEPCGLTQLYGLRFGTLPVVTLTGGLADTVIPASPAGLVAGVATGLQVHPITADALSRGFDHLHALWRQPELWRRMAKNAMRHPVGWDVSAAAYRDLYASLL